VFDDDFPWCTYLTFYSGNKLPPFYIGYTSVKQIDKGYRGTITSERYKKIWKQELKDHPELFRSHILTYHKTKEEAKKKETYFQRYYNVHTNTMYINCAINGEKFYAPIFTKEYREKCSTARKRDIHSKTI